MFWAQRRRQAGKQMASLVPARLTPACLRRICYLCTRPVRGTTLPWLPRARFISFGRALRHSASSPSLQSSRPTRGSDKTAFPTRCSPPCRRLLFVQPARRHAASRRARRGPATLSPAPLARMQQRRVEVRGWRLAIHAGRPTHALPLAFLRLPGRVVVRADQKARVEAVLTWHCFATLTRVFSPAGRRRSPVCCARATYPKPIALQPGGGMFGNMGNMGAFMEQARVACACVPLPTLSFGLQNR